MKVGNIKIKRHYLIAQMVMDVFALLLLILIGQATFSLMDTLTLYNKYLEENQVAVVFETWYPSLIWPIAALLVVAASLVVIYRSRKLPKRYRIDESNAQKYYDIIVTAVGAIRIIVLLGIFDMMYIHHQTIMHQNPDYFSVQVLCDIVVIILIIRISVHRIRGIEPKQEEEKPRELTEN